MMTDLIVNAKWVDIVGSLAAILTTISFFPQAWHSFKTRDVSGVSLGMYSVFTVGVALWLVYGLLLRAWPIVVANVITLGLALAILGMKLVFGRVERVCSKPTSAIQQTISKTMEFMPIGPTEDRELSLTLEPNHGEYATFYTRYGECFSAWSGVEGILLNIYMTLMSSPDYATASGAFYAVTGFRAKLEIVDAVVTNSKRVKPEQLSEWLKVSENLRKKSRRRNELAHNTIYFGRIDGASERTMFVAHPRTPMVGSRLRVHDLELIRGTFNSLNADLFVFWQKLLSQSSP